MDNWPDWIRYSINLLQNCYFFLQIIHVTHSTAIGFYFLIYVPTVVETAVRRAADGVVHKLLTVLNEMYRPNFFDCGSSNHLI